MAKKKQDVGTNSIFDIFEDKKEKGENELDRFFGRPRGRWHKGRWIPDDAPTREEVDFALGLFKTGRN